MMQSNEVLALITAEPFEPFRIHTASGRIFEVRHPEFAAVGRTTMTVYAAPEDDPKGPQRWEKISLMLIESVTPLKFPVNSAAK